MELTKKEKIIAFTLVGLMFIICVTTIIVTGLDRSEKAKETFPTTVISVSSNDEHTIDDENCEEDFIIDYGNTGSVYSSDNQEEWTEEDWNKYNSLLEKSLTDLGETIYIETDATGTKHEEIISISKTETGDIEITNKSTGKEIEQYVVNNETDENKIIINSNTNSIINDYSKTVNLVCQHDKGTYSNDTVEEKSINNSSCTKMITTRHTFCGLCNKELSTEIIASTENHIQNNTPEITFKTEDGKHKKVETFKCYCGTHEDTYFVQDYECNDELFIDNNGDQICDICGSVKVPSDSGYIYLDEDYLHSFLTP